MLSTLHKFAIRDGKYPAPGRLQLQLTPNPRDRLPLVRPLRLGPPTIHLLDRPFRPVQHLDPANDSSRKQTLHFSNHCMCWCRGWSSRDGWKSDRGKQPPATLSPSVPTLGRLTRLGRCPIPNRSSLCECVPMALSPPPNASDTQMPQLDCSRYGNKRG